MPISGLAGEGSAGPGAPSLPGCGARLLGCPSRSGEAQGAFVWVPPLGPRKCRLPRVVLRRDGAVGQVKGDSGGSPSLSVFVGGGERAAQENIEAFAPARSLEPDSPDSVTCSGRCQDPLWRCIFRPHLDPGKKRSV